MKMNIFSVLFALLLLVLFAATVVVAGSSFGKNNPDVTYGMENPICFHCHAKRVVHCFHFTSESNAIFFSHVWGVMGWGHRAPAFIRNA